jgi:hypothetical protein
MVSVPGIAIAIAFLLREYAQGGRRGGSEVSTDPGNIQRVFGWKPNSGSAFGVILEFDSPAGSTLVAFLQNAR